jgi:putative acetyltransferase
MNSERDKMPAGELHDARDPELVAARQRARDLCGDLRKYQLADCDDVLGVWAAASALAHPFLTEGFLERERQEIRRTHLPSADTWVWEADGRVVGFISLLGSEIGAIFVDPNFHRAGIGRALVNQARAVRGDLEVEVFERNLLGRAFYAQLGFEFMERKVHDHTGLGVIRLRLNASPPMNPVADEAVERRRPSS